MNINSLILTFFQMTEVVIQKKLRMGYVVEFISTFILLDTTNLLKKSVKIGDD